MSTTTRITNGAIAAAVSSVFGASAVYAETVNSIASVEIITGFTFVETTPFNFGDIAVLKTISTGTDVTVTMNDATGVRTTTDATEVALLAGTGAETNLVLDASSAPPFTAMLVTVPETAALSVGTNPDIVMSALVEDAGGVTTDAAGALTLKYGADLVFSQEAVYGAGTYTGTFAVTLDFP